MIEIKEVTTKKEQKEFLNFPIKLYKGNPYFVPPLYGDEAKIFRKDYMYYDHSEAVYYNAYEDGKMVGRIQGILQKASNKKTNEKRIRFNRFDSIDSQEVATALFNAVENWAKEKGMNRVCGPLGFSDLEREGLLIEGFDQLSTFEEQYNYDYYPKLIENCGYGKEVDWLERKIYAPDQLDPHMVRLCDVIMRRYKLHYAQTKSKKEFLKRYAHQIFDLIDTTYDDLYGTVPFTEGMKQMLINNFNFIISLDLTSVIVDENDKVVCFGMSFASIAKAVQKSNGHLTPLAIIRILHSIKHPKVLDLALIGVLPEYAKRGVSSAFMAALANTLINSKVEYAETNLNLEDNYAIHNEWKKFNSVQHKRRRSYIKDLD